MLCFFLCFFVSFYLFLLILSSNTTRYPSKKFGQVRISAIKHQHSGLHVGDVIFEVDGKYLLESSYAEIIQTVKEAGNVVKLVVGDPFAVDSARFTDAREAAIYQKAVDRERALVEWSQDLKAKEHVGGEVGGGSGGDGGGGERATDQISVIADDDAEALNSGGSSKGTPPAHASAPSDGAVFNDAGAADDSEGVSEVVHAADDWESTTAFRRKGKGRRRGKRSDAASTADQASTAADPAGASRATGTNSTTVGASSGAGGTGGAGGAAAAGEVNEAGAEVDARQSTEELEAIAATLSQQIADVLGALRAANVDPHAAPASGGAAAAPAGTGGGNATPAPSVGSSAGTASSSVDGGGGIGAGGTAGFNAETAATATQTNAATPTNFATPIKSPIKQQLSDLGDELTRLHAALTPQSKAKQELPF